jgi:hypothetical protein
MNKRLSLLLSSLLFLAASCQKSELKDVVNTDNFIQVKQAAISSVSGPAVASVGDEIALTVSWPYSGNCEKFNNFKIDTLSDTTQVKLFTSTNVAEDCAGKEVTHSQVFKFKPTKSGVYYVKFAGPAGSPAIIDTLKVK